VLIIMSKLKLFISVYWRCSC